jgi:hypothetical protein
VLPSGFVVFVRVVVLVIEEDAPDESFQLGSRRRLFLLVLPEANEFDSGHFGGIAGAIP